MAKKTKKKKRVLSERGIDLQRARQHKYTSRISQQAQEIGPIPPCGNPERREAAGKSTQLFTETYLLDMFTVKGIHWPWAEYHLEMFQMGDKVIVEGGRYLPCVPRGGSKTSIIEAISLRAMLYGYRRWLTILAATTPKAEKIVDELKTILETNTMLAEDFPEVIHPILSLGRSTTRQSRQLCDGRFTRMEWGAGGIVLPDVAGSAAAGGVVTAYGLESSGFTGQKRVLPNGQQLRPDLLLIDDPQTAESSASEKQCEQRLRQIGAAMFMGPPGLPIAVLMPSTVMCAGDVVDHCIQSPDWNSTLRPMLVKWPLHMAATQHQIEHRDWWDKYDHECKARRSAAATALYAAHRGKPECIVALDKPRKCGTCDRRMDCMDAEAIVSWIHRKDPTDLSAVQHAMKLHYSNPPLFASEMQQQPLGDNRYATQLTPEQVARKVNGIPRGVILPDCLYITAHIDVHDQLLYYVVCAWEEDFTGQVIDYGVFPDQPPMFRHASPQNPMSKMFPGASKDATIVGGIERLVGLLMSRQYIRHLSTGDAVETIDLTLIDIGHHPDEVYVALRKINNKAVQPMRGLPLRATSKPFDDYEKRPGWKIDGHWYRKPQVGRDRPHFGVDVNFWKATAQNALAFASGTRGGLTLFGTSASLYEHERFAEHVAKGEYYVDGVICGTNARVYEEMPAKPGNHHFDNLVGCYVGASFLGCKPPASVGVFVEAKKEYVSFRQQQAASKTGR